MKKSDILPPRTGPNSDPVLYGVAAALAELFPPVPARDPGRAEGQAQSEGEDDGSDQD